MDRLRFGRLVAALRHESRLRGDSLTVQTQSELAEDLQLPAGTIGRIERGERATLTPAILLGLANSFQLTTRERRVFFLAASGVDASDLVRPDTPSAAGALEVARRQLSLLQVPAFVSDWHGDFLAGNGAFIRLVNQTAASMEHARFNLLAGVFTESGRATVRDAAWRQRAIRTVQIVRATSILHRDDPYFVRLLDELHTATPDFREVWQDAYHADDDNADFRVVEHFHSHFGMIRYMNTFSSVFSREGSLHLVIYLPLNSETRTLFDMLKKESPLIVDGHPTWPTHKYA